MNCISGAQTALFERPLVLLDLVDLMGDTL